MDIRQLVRLPNGHHVARISIAMMLRSLWHIVNGERARRRKEWEAVTEKAEREHRNRSEGAKKAWRTRKANALQRIESRVEFTHESDGDYGVPV
jgi:hypothetical protein